MRADGYHFMVDAVTKFYQTLRIHGWFYHPNDCLAELSIDDPHLVQAVTRVGFDHGGVPQYGPGRGFELQALRSIEEGIDDVKIRFRTESGREIVASAMQLGLERMACYPSPALSNRFIEEVNGKNLSVLDIGGRARSRVDRSQFFKVDDYIVLDILPGENVDVVGDAHNIAGLFPAERFDAFFSVSVFEHLMMPWAVVAQLNKVLKTGGLGFVSTHQTIGMHDMPWDFWRFSDTAWDALFNRHTGFEIIDRTLDYESHILPFIYRPSKLHAERSAGFEGSAVLVRKIGPCKMSWPLLATDVAETIYPDVDDGFRGFDAEVEEASMNDLAEWRRNRRPGSRIKRWLRKIKSGG